VYENENEVYPETSMDNRVTHVVPLGFLSNDREFGDSMCDIFT